MSNIYTTLEEMQKDWPIHIGPKCKNQLQAGDKINKLTVLYKTKKGKTIYDACQCDCGRYIVAAQQHIKDGHTKSCGCLIVESAKQDFIDLTGQKFGRLTVIKKIENYNNKRRGTYWLCECSCYNEEGKHPQKIIYGDSLRQGKTQSCGCLQKEIVSKIGKETLEDLTGQKIGHWTIIERAPDRITQYGKQTMWLCECDCNEHTKRIVYGSNLKSLKSTSCGCIGKSKGEDKIIQILSENNE
jgi:hypothetical protein